MRIDRALVARWMGPLGLLLGVTLSLLVPRPEQRDFARASEFSLDRALADLRVLAREPHPVGSLAHALVREHILRALGSLPIEVRKQRATVTTHMAGRTRGADVDNVIGRIKGRESTLPAILLAAHYDTVPNGPGASDDSAAVAALLETARLVVSGRPLRRDLYLLFSDGEEMGLLGARAYQRCDRRVGIQATSC